MDYSNATQREVGRHHSPAHGPDSSALWSRSVNCLSNCGANQHANYPNDGNTLLLMVRRVLIGLRIIIVIAREVVHAQDSHRVVVRGVVPYEQGRDGDVSRPLYVRDLAAPRGHFEVPLPTVARLNVNGNADRLANRFHRLVYGKLAPAVLALWGQDHSRVGSRTLFMYVLGNALYLQRAQHGIGRFRVRL